MGWPVSLPPHTYSARHPGPDNPQLSLRSSYLSSTLTPRGLPSSAVPQSDLSSFPPSHGRREVPHGRREQDLRA